ncbi:MAG: hypothetical protein RL092_828 [Bacteroidota bacterium]|jgi:hypothetical protein
MKVPRENISFPHKSKLRKEAFTDEEISKILRAEGAATHLNSEVKAVLKKTRALQLVYWIGASAASAILLFFLISQLYTEQNQVAATQEQQPSIQNVKPCNLDSLLSIRAYAPKLAADSIIYDWPSFQWDPIYLSNFPFYGCGGQVYLNPWEWSNGSWWPNLGLPQYQGTTYVDINESSITLAKEDSMLCAQDSIQRLKQNLVLEEMAVVETEEYLTVKSWLKTEWENRTSFLKKAKKVWKKIRSKNNEEEDYIQIANKGKSIHL